MRYFGFIETYKDAKGHCEELNAELVTIKSEELQTLLFIDFFRTFFNKNNKVRNKKSSMICKSFLTFF